MGGTGVYYGVGYGDWVGYGEGYTGYPATCKAEVPDSGAGPRKPCKGWSGVVWGCSAPDPADHPLPAVGARSAVSRLSPGKTRLWANIGEIKVNIL